MLRRTLITASLAVGIAAAALTASAPGSRSTIKMDPSAPATPSLATSLALARLATAKLVNNLPLAKAYGYTIITKMIPHMGYHYMNPKIAGFDVQKPPILVYEHRGSTWQLGALEWAWTSKPATPPLPGARYGSFGAGCHYADGSFYPAAAQSGCPATAPSGAKFSFWHPLLITMHVWLWYPNPSGLFASTNPLVSVFDKD
jgi:hypothetical protein